MTIGNVVKKYIECGNVCGFAIAEFVLLEFLPESNPFGVCRDVLQKSWGDFVSALQGKIDSTIKTRYSE